MTIFFSADWHLGHFNIIKYCDRPFVTAEDMDYTIISNANQEMSLDDELYHLGDFTLMGTNAAINYINRLTIKRIHLIPGSHDVGWLGKKGQRSAYLEQQTQGKAKVEPSLMTLKYEKKKIVLCHYAMRVWETSHHGSWHLYGHSHNNLPGHGRSFDVGVDAWDFKPVSFEQVCKKLEKE